MVDSRSDLALSNSFGASLMRLIKLHRNLAADKIASNVAI